MEEFEFDLNVFVEIGLKYQGQRFEKMPRNQITELRDAILNQTEEIIDFYCNINEECFKGPFPIIITGEKGIYKITAGFIFMNNSIECINIPVCIEKGNDYREAFNKIIVSIIECLDVRLKRNMNLTENIVADKSFKNCDSISSQEFIDNLREAGWEEIVRMPFHTILLKKNCPITFTIPNETNISQDIHWAFDRYRFYHEENTKFWQ